MLVNGKKRRVRMVEQNSLGAVPVVDIEHGDPLHSGGERFKGRNGDGVKVAKAHRMILRGVMAGRTNQAERSLAAARQFQRLQGAARRPQCMVINPGMRWRVTVKGFCCGFHMGYVLLRVSAQKLFLLHLQRRGPFQR